MRRAITMIIAAVALNGCKEDPKTQTREMENEIAVIHSQTLNAILENDEGFVVEMEKQEKFYAELREDLARCKQMEGRLLKNANSTRVTDLEKATIRLLELVEIRVKTNETYRRWASQSMERLRIQSTAPSQKSDNEQVVPPNGP